MKKIIELRQIMNTYDQGKHVWKVAMIVRNGSEYAQETWTRECVNPEDDFVTQEEKSLWRFIYDFIPENRTNYSELHRVFKKYGFEVEMQDCKIYPTYWEQDPPMDKYLVYAGKIVYKK